MEECETIVVGAGLAGLTLASDLVRSGADVLLLEKSRGLGGRMATRRTDTGTFDHGAQFLDPETAEFRDFLMDAVAAGAAAEWDGLSKAKVYVGVPGMSGLVSSIAQGLRVRFQVEVAAVEANAGTWSLKDSEGRALAASRRLVLAVPAPQAQRLLGAHPMAKDLSVAAYTPCWTLMAAFADPLPLPKVLRDADPVLPWIARDNSKPGRTAEYETWVVQAAADWSAANLERERAEIRDILLEAFAVQTGNELKPVYASAHRWRYALVAEPLGQPCLVHEETALVAVGDWCLGPRAEHAFLSGRAGAEAVRRL
ncbi:MAG: FAD-dependent oxidoreductase [Pseudomonadota bacterium]